MAMFGSHSLTKKKNVWFTLKKSAFIGHVNVLYNISHFVGQMIKSLMDAF